MKKLFIGIMICFLMVNFCSSVLAGDVIQMKTTFVVIDPTDPKGDILSLEMRHMGVDIDYNRHQIMAIYYLPELHSQYPTVFPEMVMLMGPYNKGHKTRLTWINSPTKLEGYTEFVNP